MYHHRGLSKDVLRKAPLFGYARGLFGLGRLGETWSDPSYASGGVESVAAPDGTMLGVPAVTVPPNWPLRMCWPIHKHMLFLVMRQALR